MANELKPRSIIDAPEHFFQANVIMEREPLREFILEKVADGIPRPFASMYSGPLLPRCLTDDDLREIHQAALAWRDKDVMGVVRELLLLTDVDGTMDMREIRDKEPNALGMRYGLGFRNPKIREAMLRDPKAFGSVGGACPWEICERVIREEADPTTTAPLPGMDREASFKNKLWITDHWIVVRARMGWPVDAAVAGGVLEETKVANPSRFDTLVDHSYVIVPTDEVQEIEGRMQR